jgi:hypothetical protein
MRKEGRKMKEGRKERRILYICYCMWRTCRLHGRRCHHGGLGSFVGRKEQRKERKDGRKERR